MDEVIDDPAMPVVFLRTKKGMGGGEPLEDRAQLVAQARWRAHAMEALVNAKEAHEAGEARESVNARVLPYIYTHSIRTSCEAGWMNFFGLRLDKAARPEIRVLAEKMWEAWNESKPEELEPGDWHLPLITDEDIEKGWTTAPSDGYYHWGKISAARCARQSFTYNKTHTIEEDLALYERLVDATPIHLGPLEHQATPDTIFSRGSVLNKFTGKDNPWVWWDSPDLHGNLPGWIQFRKTIPGESIAPLPKEYQK